MPVRARELEVRRFLRLLLAESHDDEDGDRDTAGSPPGQAWHLYSKPRTAPV